MAINAVQAGPRSAAGGGSGPASYQLAVTLAASTTVIVSPVGTPAAKDMLSVILTQDGVGSRAITWDAAFDSSTSVNIQFAASKKSRFFFVAEVDNLWHLFAPPALDE